MGEAELGEELEELEKKEEEDEDESDGDGTLPCNRDSSQAW